MMAGRITHHCNLQSTYLNRTEAATDLTPLTSFLAGVLVVAILLRFVHPRLLGRLLRRERFNTNHLYEITNFVHSIITWLSVNI